MIQFFVFSILLVPGMMLAAPEKQPRVATEEHAHETAVEDLAGEHGIVERLLLIYEEMLRRLKADEAFDAHDLFLTADMMHRFVEQYHEKVEEEYVFPVFEKAHKSERLTAELRKQHEAGRAITVKVLELARNAVWDKKQKRILKKLLSQFVTMYRVHISREDTDIFPQFRKMVSKAEYERLSEQFDDLEEELFGKHAYKKFLEQIEAIEKRLAIFDIADVTPAEE